MLKSSTALGYPPGCLRYASKDRRIQPVIAGPKGFHSYGVHVKTLQDMEHEFDFEGECPEFDYEDDLFQAALKELGS